MAELADARDLKSREIFSRTGSTPASGTNNIAGWSSPVARRAHNPKVGGSNPPPATIKKASHTISMACFFVVILLAVFFS